MKKYILIFRTSVRNKQDIKRIETLFVQFPQIDKWHVDLENWEKVLRIECREMIPATILNALQTIHIMRRSWNSHLSQNYRSSNEPQFFPMI